MTQKRIVQSAISKLALLSKVGWVVILSFVIESSAAQAHVILSDFFVFQSGNEIYSHQDLAEYQESVVALSCWYADSQVVKFYISKLIVPEKKIEAWHNSESTKDFINFIKMIRYAKAQSVQVKPELIAALRDAAVKQGCPLTGIADSSKTQKSLSTKMMNIVELEVYLRSRFENYNESSLISLEQSMERQVEHEFYGDTEKL